MFLFALKKLFKLVIILDSAWDISGDQVTSVMTANISESTILSAKKRDALLEDMLPVVSDRCLKTFYECTNTPYTLRELLYNHTDARKELCRIRRRYETCVQVTTKTLIQPDGQKKYEHEMMCQESRHVNEVSLLEKFVCLDYHANGGDSYEDNMPPISDECAAAYWTCGNVRANFLERLSDDHKSEMCQSSTWNDDACTTVPLSNSQHTCYKSVATKIKHYLCHYTHSNVSAPTLDEECLKKVMWCYAEKYTIFPVLAAMKNETTQLYMCGRRLHWCLVFDGYSCSTEEANVAEEFLCSDAGNMAFTPDPYELFMLGDECRVKGFERCYAGTPSELRDNFKRRRQLCKAGEPYRYCAEEFCNQMEMRIIEEFLCFREDNSIVEIKFECIVKFALCFEARQMFQMSYSFANLEDGEMMLDKLYLCVDKERNNTCMTHYDDFSSYRCALPEWDTIKEFLCTFGNDTSLRISENCLQRFQSCYSDWKAIGRDNSRLNDTEKLAKRKDMCSQKKQNRACMLNKTGIQEYLCSEEEVEIIETIVCWSCSESYIYIVRPTTALLLALLLTILIPNMRYGA